MKKEIRTCIYLAALMIVLAGCATNITKQVPIPVMQQLKTTPTIESAVYYGLGDAALQTGDYQNALPLLQLADKFDPNSIMVKQSILETLWAISRTESTEPTEMIKYGEGLISSGQFNEQILGLMADAYVAQKEPGKAIDVIEYLIKIKPDGMNYFRLFILNAKYFNKIKKDLLDAAWKRSGNNEYILLAIGDVYSQLDPAKAEIIFNQAYDTFKDDLTFKAMSNYYARQNQKTKLINTLKKDITKLNPTQLQVYVELLYETKQWKEIIQRSEYLIAEGNSSVLRYLFAAGQNENNIDIMTSSYKRIRVDSDLTSEDIGWFALSIGDFYLQADNFVDAAPYFAQVSNYQTLIGYIANQVIMGIPDAKLNTIITMIKLLSAYGYPKEMQAYVLAQTFYLADDTTSAIESIREVPDTYFSENDMLPEAAQLYLATANDSLKAQQLLNLRKVKMPATNTLMGQFYMFAQNDTIAKTFFDREFQSNPEPDTLFFRYAATLADRHNRLADQERLLEKAISLYPNNTEFLNWYGYFLVTQNKDLEKAEKLIRKAVERDSTNGFYWDSLAWLYYQKGSYQEALTAMKIPIEKGTKNSVVSYHLGEIMYKLNQFKEANSYFKESITVNDDRQAVRDAQKALDTYLWSEKK